MSTVTTRICQYEHTDPRKRESCPYWHEDQTIAVITEKATNARLEKQREQREQKIARVEQMLADGTHRRVIVQRLGYEKPSDLRRSLRKFGREDLAGLFINCCAPYRCALEGCDRYVYWIEDPGLDEDDEPIAEWSSLCGICQRFEDLCEDIEFLLDPSRGNETSVFNICARVGYEASQYGLDSLRQKLKRHGRLDLRDALDIESVKPQRGWYVQGTVRSDINTHWKRLVAAEGVRAHERLDADPGRKLSTTIFR